MQATVEGNVEKWMKDKVQTTQAEVTSKVISHKSSGTLRHVSISEVRFCLRDQRFRVRLNDGVIIPCMRCKQIRSTQRLKKLQLHQIEDVFETPTDAEFHVFLNVPKLNDPLFGFPCNHHKKAWSIRGKLEVSVVHVTGYF